MTPPFQAPRGPIFSWSSLSRERESSGVPAIDDAPHRVLTTSGRAALFLAIRELACASRSSVLVPTYHCPTMVAPIVHAGLTPLFYGIDPSGLSDLDRIDAAAPAQASAIIVPHLFGYGRSLNRVRNWCDARGVALIEDCAHSFFGMAGERPLGAWGDVAIASVTKFFPVPEAGLLVSHHRNLRGIALARQDALAEVKGVFQLLEAAAKAGRFGWMFGPLKAMSHLRLGRRAVVSSHTKLSSDPLQGCDMSRSARAPLSLAATVLARLPRAVIVTRRRSHHATLLTRLEGLPGCRPLLDGYAGAVPYALPLWVDDADRVYHGLRERGMAVYRWDFCWRRTPKLEGDCGEEWRDHVLQLLCHQDLRERDLEALCDAVVESVRATPASSASKRRPTLART